MRFMHGLKFSAEFGHMIVWCTFINKSSPYLEATMCSQYLLVELVDEFIPRKYETGPYFCSNWCGLMQKTRMNIYECNLCVEITK